MSKAWTVCFLGFFFLKLKLALRFSTSNMARNAFEINCIFYKYRNRTMLYNHLALQLSTFYKNELMFSCFCLCRYPNVPLKERVKTAQNWYHGFCKKWTLLKWKTKLLPWLQLDGNVLYLSQAAKIGAYSLSRDSRRLQRIPLENFSGHKGDVCRFVLTDSHLISGGRSRNTYFFSAGLSPFHPIQPHLFPPT
uniref:Secreted protein n=1 Tax=Xiphophorus couchianus TaxID=32473 RepID=A0A3B5M5K1_9TELE